MKKLLSGLRMAAVGSIATVGMTPPAQAQLSEMMQCFANCYEAYVVQTFQPIFHAQCREICRRQYTPDLAASRFVPISGVLRYS